MQQFVCQKL